MPFFITRVCCKECYDFIAGCYHLYVLVATYNSFLPAFKHFRPTTIVQLLLNDILKYSMGTGKVNRTFWHSDQVIPHLFLV